MSKKILILLCMFTVILVSCSNKKDDAGPYIPSAPSNLTVTGGNGLLEATWDNVTGADGYIVYLSVLGSTGKPVETTLTNHAEITGLTNGQEYTVMVASRNANGRGGLSKSVIAIPRLRVSIPSKVTGLTGTAGDASVNLSWQAAAGAAAYRIYVNPTGDAGNLIVFVVSGLTYKVTGLTNGQSYGFKVAAVNDKNITGVVSDVFTATPIQAAVPPSVPSGFTASAANGAVMLQWDGVSGAASYAVYQSSSESGPYSIIHTATSTTYNVTGLTNGTGYWFKIASINSAGIGAATTPIGVTPSVPVTPPAAVSGLAASGVLDGVNLSWSSVDGADSYKIYVSDSENGNYALNSDTSGHSFIVKNLTAGHAYWFKVAASNVAGVGGMGSAVTASVAVVPAVPKNFNAASGNGQAVLSWDVSAGAASYVIYQSPSPSNFVPIARTAASPYTVTGLTNGTEYFFQVEAENNFGKAMSLIQSATPKLPLTVPSVPLGVTATAGNALAHLSWNGVSGALFYNIYQSDSENGVYAQIQDTRHLSDNVTGLSNDTTYYFKITANNAVGESEKSIPVAATPKAPIVVPPAPTGLSAVPGDSSVALSWQHVPQADIYDIYQSIGGAAHVNIVSVSASPYTVTGLANGVEHSYKILAKNGAGSGEFSALAVAVPKAPIVIPPAPHVMSVSSGDGYVDLVWSSALGAVTYAVYVSKDGLLASTLHVSGTSTRVSELKNGALYSFQVAALNSAGESAPSSAVTGTPKAPIVVPPAPTGLSAIPSNGSVALSWEHVPQADTYDIYQSIGGAAYVNIASVSAFSYTATGLANGVEHSYKISAKNGAGSGGFSSTVAVTPKAPVTIPPTPQVTSLFPGDGFVSVAWLPSLGAEIYTVYTSIGGRLVSTYSGVATSVKIPELANGSQYSFQVTASNSAGESAPSSISLSIPQAPTVVPAAPGSLKAQIGDGQVSLTWDAIQAANNYVVYMSSDNLTFTAAAATASAEVTVRGLTNGKIYYFKVTAVNAAGESNARIVVAAIPLAPIIRPATPTILTAVPGDRAIILYWTAAVGAAAYNVYTSPNDENNYTLALANTTVTNNIIMQLVNGTTYYIKVAAVNGIGESLHSLSVSATPRLPAAAPSIPLGLSATAGDGKALLSWGASTGAISYNIYKLNPISGNFELYAIYAGTKYTATGLTNGTQYQFKISAKNSAGESALSSAITVTPQVQIPIAPTAINATSAHKQIALSWNEVTGAARYNVYFKKSNDANYVEKCGNLASPLCIIPISNNGVTYNMQITSVTSDGRESPRSQTITATPNAAVVPAPIIARVTTTPNAGVCAAKIEWLGVDFPPNIDYYTLYIAYGGVNSAYSMLESNITALNYTHNFSKDYTYWIKIRANAAGKTSEYSYPIVVSCQ